MDDENNQKLSKTPNSSGVGAEFESQLTGQPGFTPGPWRLEEDDWRHVIANNGESETEIATIWLQQGDEGQMNARLIASSLALYEAAEKSLDFIKSVYEFRLEDGSLPFGTVDYYDMERLMGGLQVILKMVHDQDTNTPEAEPSSPKQ